MLPEKSAGKVLQATVVAVGPGSVNPVRSSKLGLTLDQALLKGGGHWREWQVFYEEGAV